MTNPFGESLYRSEKNESDNWKRITLEDIAKTVLQCRAAPFERRICIRHYLLCKSYTAANHHTSVTLDTVWHFHTFAFLRGELVS